LYYFAWHLCYGCSHADKESKQHIKQVLAAKVDNDPNDKARQQTNTIKFDVRI